MGIMNYSKGGFTGSVGAQTGRNWKGLNVLAVKSAPTYTRTEAQASVREGFKRFNHWVSIFAPEIKYDVSLNVAKMSVRNAIVSANKEYIKDATYGYENFAINQGGRQKPISFTATNNEGLITCTWTKPTSTVYSDKTKMIILIVDEDDEMCEVLRVAPDAETATNTINMGTNSDIYVYAWLLDTVGSTRVGSKNVGIKIAHS